MAAAPRLGGRPVGSLRQQQREMIKNMLRSGANQDDVEEIGLPKEPEWKILVYDKYGENILSPLLSVSELRELGVTLYLHLNTERENIPDTTVVYFVLPTQQNIDRICKDLSEDLYDKCHLNFLSAVPSDLLEQLATKAVSSQTSCEIERVFDMYTNFISLEDDMFVMRHQEREKVSYLALNSPSDDAEMGAAVDDIVTSLFCALVSNGQVPLIRASRGHAAEMIAGKLDKKLRDHLKLSRTQLFREGMSALGSFQRPLLVLLDRHVDLATMLHHTCTYQALTHDVLDYTLNKVEYLVEDKNSEGTVSEKREKFYLDSRHDPFWQANRGLPFPQVVEAVEQELAACKKREAQIRNAGSGGDGDPSLESNTNRIKDAVSSLPQLLEQKRQLTGHMSLLMAVMDKIKKGKHDSYYSLEEEIMTGASPSESVADVVKAGGSQEDKLRLMLIALLGKTVKADDVSRAEAVLKESGCDLDSVAYIQELNKQRTKRSAKVSGGAAKEWSFDILSSGSKLFSEGGFKDAFKRLLPTNSSGVVTQIVEALMDFKSTELTKDYLYFDPKQVRAGSSRLDVPKSRAPVDECMVFMVGGGNFCEYQNLVDAAARKKKTVTYGCTNLSTPDEFVHQLASVQRSLGGEQHAKSAGKK